MEEYLPNSHKAKEDQQRNIPEKKIQKIVSGNVKTKKKNMIWKLANFLIPEDVENVKAYIVEDIVVPAVKDIILDAVRAFLGVNGKRTNTSTESWRKYYNGSQHSSNASKVQSGYYYDDIVLDSRGEAELVLEQLDELIEHYGIASVSDLNEMLGISGNFTDNKYGWTNIRSAQVVRIRDGYLLKMPRAQPLN